MLKLPFSLSSAPPIYLPSCFYCLSTGYFLRSLPFDSIAIDVFKVRLLEMNYKKTNWIIVPSYGLISLHFF